MYFVQICIIYFKYIYYIYFFVFVFVRQISSQDLALDFGRLVVDVVVPERSLAKI